MNYLCFLCVCVCVVIPTGAVFRQIVRLKVESDQNVNDPDIKVAILEEVRHSIKHFST